MTDYTIEAEDLNLDGYTEVSHSQGSGGGFIQTWGEGTASIVFEGVPGTYNINLDVFDETDGQSSIDLIVNGEVVGTVTLDVDEGGNYVYGTAQTVSFEGVEIQPGDTIELQGSRDGGEPARIDTVHLNMTSSEIEAEGPVTLLQESFSNNFFGNVEESDLWIGNGVVGTNAAWDGAMQFRTVDMTGYENAKLTLDAELTSGSFEATGQWADFLQVQLVGPDGSVVVLDTFAGNGQTLVGSETGQQIDPGMEELSWDIPAGMESFQIRIVSDISACNEVLCLDNFKIVADQVPAAADNNPPVALDDDYVTDELTAVSGNILENDSDPDGDPISVVSVEGGNVGEPIPVTTDKGYTGTVTVDAQGNFTFTPDDNFKALAQDEQDSFTLNYTIADDPSAIVKHNLLFVLDISNSTVGTSGENVFDGVGVGDQNGDGVSDTVLDAQIAGVISAVQKLIADGVNPADIDIGLVTFSGEAAGYTNIDAETIGTFALDDPGLFDAVTGIQSGGWTNYEAGLQEAESWLASQQGDGAKNKVMFLSDGRPYVGYDQNAGEYIAQSTANYGDEVAAIANTYGADIYAIGVGANSDLDYLNDLDNTGGAEQVLDTTQLNAVLETAVTNPGTANATITVTINGLNEGPDAVNDAVSIFEDETATLNILTNDSDPDGDAISITEVGGLPVNTPIPVTTLGGREGTVTVDENGNLTFTPGEAFESMIDGDVDSFQLNYTITDGQFDDAATITVTINGKGLAIDANDDAYTIGETEDAVGNILNNDVPNDGSLSVSSVAFAGTEYTVGESFEVTTVGGRTGTVTVDESGAFVFDGGDNFIEMGNGDVDSFVLDYTAALPGSTTSGTRVIDFEGLSAGDVVSGQISGVTISAARNNDTDGVNDAMIFDTFNPTGGDQDLATTTQGKVLIISEDNDSTDPDDNAGGGVVNFTFDNPEEIQQITFLDTEEGGATITLTLADGSTQSMTGPQTLNGHVGTFTVGVANVVSMEISMIGSGAIDDIVLTDTTDVPGLEADARVTVTINGENELGDGDETANVKEDAGLVSLTNAMANTFDPELGSTTTISAVGDAGAAGVGVRVAGVRADGSTAGEFIIGSDGSVQFDTMSAFDDLGRDESDTVSITYDVTDSTGETVTSTYTVTVDGNNNVIEANDDELTTTEGVPQTINILDNDVDLDGDVITVVDVNGTPPGTPLLVTTVGQRTGTITFQEDGTFTFDPGTEFDDLFEGQSDTVTVVYTATDGIDTDTATVEITVNGEGVFVPPDPETTPTDFSGTVITESSSSNAIAIVIDMSSTALAGVAGATVGDLNGDGRTGTVVDIFLGQIIEMASGMDDDQELALIPTGQTQLDAAGNAISEAVGEVLVVTAGQIKEAAPSWMDNPVPSAAVRELFSPITDDALDNTIDLDKGLTAAETYLNGAGGDANEVMVLTSTDNFDIATFTDVSDPTATVGRLTDDAGLDADIDVVLIENGYYAEVASLNAVDSDMMTDVIEVGDAFGLDSLIDPAPSVSAGDVVSLKIDDVEYAVTDADPNADGFQVDLLDIEIEIGATPTVFVGLDNDGSNDGVADQFIDVSGQLTPGTDSFDFGVLDATNDLLV